MASPIASDEVALKYFVELDRPTDRVPPKYRLPTDALANVHQTIVSSSVDALPDEGYYLFLTTDAGDTPALKLYVLTPEAGQFTILNLPSGLRVLQPRFVKRGGFVQLVFTGDACDSGKEASVYLCDLNGQELRLLARGSGFGVSPDRHKVLFLCEDRRGYHSINLWDAQTDLVTHLFSVWHADPDSGSWREYRWSADSKALRLKGSMRGFSKNSPGECGEFDLLYLVGEDRLFSIPQGRRSRSEGLSN